MVRGNNHRSSDIRIDADNARRIASRRRFLTLQSMVLSGAVTGTAAADAPTESGEGIRNTVSIDLPERIK